MRLDSHRLRRGFLVFVGMLAASPVVAQDKGWEFGPGAKLSRKASKIELQLTGYVQEDFRHFSDDYANSRSELAELAEGADLRRLRMTPF